MIEDFYFDTSIWIDFYEKRNNNGELALKFILKIIEEDLKIAYSDLNIKEFKNLGYAKNEIDSIFRIAKPKNLIHIHIFPENLEEARKLARQRNVPNKDVLHAILARDNNLQLISRDHHFEKLKDITEVKLPEDFT